MKHLHDSLHAMPWWVILGLSLLLGFAMFANNPEFQHKGFRTNVVDNIGSWVSLFVTIFGTIVYYWV